MKQIKFYILISLCVLMLGCSTGGGYDAPVTVIGETHTLDRNVYVVRSGDTLYSIAWVYGYDYRDLARWNDIQAPYTLYKGQTLSLTSQKLHHRAQQKKKAAPVAKNTPSIKPRVKEQNRSSRVKQSARDRSIVKNMLKRGRWYKPAQGKVVKVSNSSFYQRKGIEIKGQYGSRVRAAAPGKVVYSGTGVRGCG